MNKKKKLYVFLSGALVSMFLTSAFLISPYGADVYVSLSHLFGGKTTAKLMRIEKIVDDKFMGEVHTEYLTDMAARAYVGSLGDRYSTYFSANDFKRMSENLDGGYHGIGIQVETKDGKICISHVMPSSPAEKAGLKDGDNIVRFKGEDCDGNDLKTVTNTIKNASEGENFLFGIERNGSVFDALVKVGDIELDYIKSELLPGAAGYVRIETFGNEVAPEFKDSVNALIDEGATSLIFDVRSNPGGVLDSVVEMVDFLVPEGTITSVRQKNGREQVFKSDKSEINLPMCVLINSESASASEIFSAALSEYGKATLIGEKTFGKGVVQGVFELGDNTGISITIAKYFTPLGNSIDGVGVSPHIEVSLSDDVVIREYNAHIDGDVQLEVALDVLGVR